MLGVYTWSAVQNCYSVVVGESELPPAPQFQPPVVPFVQDSLGAARASTAKPTSTRTPRFHAGSRVLYNDREHDRAVQGTVAKLKSGQALEWKSSFASAEL